MSLREDNEKRDRQLRKESDLFRTGYLAGLDAAIDAVNNRTDRILGDSLLPESEVIEILQALKEGGIPK